MGKTWETLEAESSRSGLGSDDGDDVSIGRSGSSSDSGSRCLERDHQNRGYHGNGRFKG